MYKILCLDLGTKRVGVAKADDLGLTAQGLTVLERKPHAKFIESIKQMVAEYRIETILLGMPIRMDGTKGPETQRVMAMVHELRRGIPGINVETWDERLSTTAVERVLIEADLTRKKRKQVVDKVAAVYILQNYLDYLHAHHREAD